MDMSIQAPSDETPPSDYLCHGPVFETDADDSDADAGKSLADVMDKVLLEIALDRSSPLVTIDAVDTKNNGLSVTFHDRANPGMRYEFWCHGQADALEWVAHMAPKTWVTKRHLEIFARRVAEHFPEPRHGKTIVRTFAQLREEHDLRVAAASRAVSGAGTQ